MKLWEVLRDGRVGQQYKCQSKQSSWNGRVYNLLKTDDSYCLIEFGKTSLLELCAAVIDAEWISQPRQVTFEQAMVALWECEDIRVEDKGFDPQEYSIVLGCVLDTIVRDGSDNQEWSRPKYHFSFSQIINGRWYIL